MIPSIASAAGPTAIGAMARFAVLAAEDDAFLSAQARVALQRIISSDASLERVSLLALEAPIARRVVAAWLETLGVVLNGELIADVLRAAQRGSVTPLPGDRVLDASGSRLSVRSAPGRKFHGNSS